MGYWNYAPWEGHQSTEYPRNARSVTFGGINSFRDLHLILQKTEETPPEPKLNLIDIAGADGSRDLSEQPGGRIVYADREFVWTFGLYPHDSWREKQREVSNALNGKYCEIHIPADNGEKDDFHYVGRLIVNKYKRDGVLRQITIKAICRPYALRNVAFCRVYDLSADSQKIVISNDRMPVIPELITTADETTVVFNGATFVMSAGTYQYTDIEFVEGNNTLEAKVTSGTGTLTVKFRGGTL